MLRSLLIIACLALFMTAAPMGGAALAADEAVAAERQNEKLEEDLHSRLTEEVSLAYPPSVMISVGDGAK